MKHGENQFLENFWKNFYLQNFGVLMIFTNFEVVGTAWSQSSVMLIATVLESVTRGRCIIFYTRPAIVLQVKRKQSYYFSGITISIKAVY